MGFKSPGQGLALMAPVTVAELPGFQEKLRKRVPIIPSGVAQRLVLRIPLFPCLLHPAAHHGGIRLTSPCDFCMHMGQILHINIKTSQKKEKRNTCNILQAE